MRGERQQRHEAQIRRNIKVIGQGRIQPCGAQACKNLGLIQLVLLELHVRVQVAKAAAHARQHHLREGHEATDGQAPAHLAGNVVGQITEPCSGGKDRPRLSHELAATLGEAETLRMAAQEQLQAELLFQLRGGGRD